MMFSHTALAQSEDITVTVNGRELETPITAKIINERTMLPMRSVFEALGASVTWKEADRMIFATKGNTLITFKIGVPKMSVQTIESDKNTAVFLDTAPYIEDGYTLVPVRAAAEAFMAQVDWNGDTRTVAIITQ